MGLGRRLVGSTFTCERCYKPFTDVSDQVSNIIKNWGKLGLLPIETGYEHYYCEKCKNEILKEERKAKLKKINELNNR